MNNMDVQKFVEEKKVFNVIFVQFDNVAKTYMYWAPKYSNICVGDEVELEDTNDIGTVMAMKDIDVNYNTDISNFKFWIMLCQATLPLKRVLAVIKTTKIEYKEDEADE